MKDTKRIKIVTRLGVVLFCFLTTTAQAESSSTGSIGGGGSSIGGGGSSSSIGGGGSSIGGGGSSSSIGGGGSSIGGSSSSTSSGSTSSTTSSIATSSGISTTTSGISTTTSGIGNIGHTTGGSFTAPNIAGTWESGSYVFQILQSGNDVTVIWHGVNYQATFLSSTELSLPPTTGILSASDTKITWSNGTVYTKQQSFSAPNIVGNWEAGTYAFPITQSGNNFVVIWHGVSYDGSFLSPTEVSLPGVTGVLSASNTVITWSNGTVYRKEGAFSAPNIAGNWEAGTYAFPITQSGNNFVVVWHGVSYDGTFLSPTEVSLPGVTGVLSNSNTVITWSNGTIYSKQQAFTAPNIAGNWDAGTYAFPITQSGNNFVVVWHGVSYDGTFLSPTEVSLPGVTGVLSISNTVITWSNGTIYNKQQVFTAPNIAGNWKAGTYAFPITQSGNNFVVVWHGVSYDGTFLSPTDVSLPGVTGVLSASNTVITWSNGTVYTLQPPPFTAPDISGSWKAGNYEFPITQNGNNFVVVWNGVSYDGSFSSPTEISLPGVTGILSMANTVITWSNGTIYNRQLPTFTAPNIAGTWAVGSYRFPITQSGNAFTVIWEGTSYAGLFLSPTEVSLPNVTGKLTGGDMQISWTNGVSYVKQ